MDFDTDLLGISRTAVRKCLQALDRSIDAVDGQLKAGDRYDSKLGSHLAFLTDSAVRCMETLRKLEKHDRDAVAQMTPKERDELVKAYIADLPKDRRDEFRQLLDEQDENESLL